MTNWSLEKGPGPMNSMQVASWTIESENGKKRHEKAESIVKIKRENVNFNTNPAKKPVMTSYQGYS